MRGKLYQDRLKYWNVRNEGDYEVAYEAQKALSTSMIVELKRLLGKFRQLNERLTIQNLNFFALDINPSLAFEMV